MPSPISRITARASGCEGPVGGVEAVSLPVVEPVLVPVEVVPVAVAVLPPVPVLVLVDVVSDAVVDGDGDPAVDGGVVVPSGLGVEPGVPQAASPSRRSQCMTHPIRLRDMYTCGDRSLR